MTQPPLTPTFHIRDIPVYGDAILAPMDGFSDWPFRSLCRALGSAMSYTEFCKAEYIVHAFKHVKPRMAYEEMERPIAFQIYGDDPDELVRAALLLQELAPDIIDINMGCPARSVAHSGAGVGLMRSPLKVARIFRKLSAALTIPVTGKIRLGWDDCKSYRLIARVIEENGGVLVAIHGRTKEQAYSGVADWDAIAEVRAALKIPVIGSGDVTTAADIERMKAHTGCPAVMIGRAAIGNPWIFSHADRDNVPVEKVHQMVRQHLERNLAYYGPRKGLLLFRKHALQYLKLQHLTRATRTKALMQTTVEGFLAVVDEIYAELKSEIENPKSQI